jgi:hypothetical protein
MTSDRPGKVAQPYALDGRLDLFARAGAPFAAPLHEGGGAARTKRNRLTGECRAQRLGNPFRGRAVLAEDDGASVSLGAKHLQQDSGDSLDRRIEADGDCAAMFI